MIFINEAYKAKTIYLDYVLGFIKLIYPFAPHMAEELWEYYGHKESITYEPWPTYEEKFLVDDEVCVAIQVNGKLRATMLISKDSSKEDTLNKALALSEVQKHLQGKEIKKTIVVVNKIVNIVVA